MSWEALTEDIRRARPPLSYQFISDAKRRLSDRDIAAQAGHEVCTDCGWCVDCDGHNMFCLTGGDSDGEG